MDLVLVGILLCLSAFFSGSESAMFSLRWWRINTLRHEGGFRGRILATLLDRPRSLLITLLLGNTLVNVAASSLTEHRLERLLPDQGLWIAIAVMTVILLVVGEITPKTLAIRSPETLAVSAARPIRWFSVLIYPLRILLERLSDLVMPIHDDPCGRRNRMDFLTLMNASRREKILDETEHTVMTRILQMEDICITDIMVPRTDIMALPDTIDFDDAVQTLLAYDLRRVPLYHENLDNIVGILYAKDLLGGWLNPVLRRSPKALARTPFYVPGFISLKQLSHELSQQKCHLAIVLDEYGGTAGLVTHDDILRTIFAPGRRDDVHANILDVLPEGGWIVEARITWNVLRRMLFEIPENLPFRTLNGFLLDRFGCVPEPGDVIELPEHGPSRWRLEVLTTEPIRVLTVRIQPVTESGDA